MFWKNRDETASTQTHLYMMIVIIEAGHSMANKITSLVHELEEGGQEEQFILHSLSNKHSVRCDHCQVLECYIT